ncbi:MAG: FKBP-type peptidyl-prolyl cis-trans isomerase [Erysipelotrichaceae bacterium]|nr:FKBP-type peptidyl-prolyl cis-trans isomerase [Erysipelotrichaceae bacterium]
MKIAVTYDNGNVFQHFGRTENFKVYTVENNEIVSSEMISSNGEGHGALANVLATNDINVVICGGLGDGALNALNNAGIEVCAGAEGNTDEVVQAYLDGTLVNTGANCDHHEEEHACGDSCGGCDSEQGCGGCPGCGAPTPLFEGKNVGKTVKAHYEGTLNDGTKFDSSYDRGEPLEFICGVGMMIRGFDETVAEMEIGEIKNIHLTPEQAYGPVNPAAIFTVNIEQMPGSEGLNVNDQVYLQTIYGQPLPATVTAKDDTTITFDTNHPMAGKDLNFKIELVSID